jgi:indoleamine 2,3-dioxygenase
MARSQSVTGMFSVTRRIGQCSQANDQQRLPPSISMPFLQAAAALEVLPIATYSALNLWNWRALSEDGDPRHPDNVESLHTLTGTDDESWFYTISNAMEARAGPIIAKSLEAIEAVLQNDSATVIDTLRYCRRSIDDIGQLLERMDERCRPQVFYHEIRPFLAGSMNMEAVGLPNGVFYDEGDGKGEWRKYRGGSNGQSSLLQFFDAILGVKHDRSAGFSTEMRKYMPGPHSRFLYDIETIANIRNYVDSHQNNVALLNAYNDAVASLSGFRDKHIQLVTRYIILPSRMAKPDQSPDRVDLATSSTKLVCGKASIQELVGTGGTKLMPFLKTSRDETMEAKVIK